MIHTIRDTPPNPSGLLALSTDSSHCYLAYPGIHDDDVDDADDNVVDDVNDSVDDDVDENFNDTMLMTMWMTMSMMVIMMLMHDAQATLTPGNCKCLTASIWPAG